MIAKKFKLPIQEFYEKNSRSVRGSCFLLKIFRSDALRSRFGVVISKKVAAKASARNVIKRLVFNFIKSHMKQMPINDYLIIVLPSAAKCSKKELLNDLNNLIPNI
ncbi:MAG: ribonuclease P protein component [bacterium]|nr:ribonuclease P protein component [bacterium]